MRLGNGHPTMESRMREELARAHAQADLANRTEAAATKEVEALRREVCRLLMERDGLRRDLDASHAALNSTKGRHELG